MSIDAAGIPQRMAYWRTRRNLSRRELGERMQPSKSTAWVEKAESGKLADFRIGALEEVALALVIPIEYLLYDASPYLECVDEFETAAIRAAICRYDVTTGWFDLPVASDPVAVKLIGRQLEYGWTVFQAAQFTKVAQLLPALIVDAARTASVDRSDRALSNASFTYQLAVAACVKFDDAPTAWQAADRAVKAAEASQDPITIASAARRSAEALICLSATARPDEARRTPSDAETALDICLNAASRLDGELRRLGADGLSMAGSLFLKAAVCAATLADKSRTTELIAQADEYATMIGHDGNAVRSGFGPTNVALHRASTLIMLEEGGLAVKAARGIGRGAFARLPTERRVNHLAELAIAHIQCGNRDAALDALLRAEDTARQEVHCRPRTRSTVARLLDADPAPSNRLRELAQRSGVPV